MTCGPAINHRTIGKVLVTTRSRPKAGVGVSGLFVFPRRPANKCEFLFLGSSPSYMTGFEQ